MDELTKELLRKISALETRINMMDGAERGWTPKFLTTPLTAAAWDGDNYNTTAKTKIDLSAVFGTPADIKAVLITTDIDDDSSAGGEYWIILSPNDTAGEGIKTRTIPHGGWKSGEAAIVPCDSGGDIYYQISASGNVMSVRLEIWGYWI